MERSRFTVEQRVLRLGRDTNKLDLTYEIASMVERTIGVRRNSLEAEFEGFSSESRLVHCLVFLCLLSP
jgi:hypothetical protein